MPIALVFGDSIDYNNLLLEGTVCEEGIKESGRQIGQWEFGRDVASVKEAKCN